MVSVTCSTELSGAGFTAVELAFFTVVELKAAGFPASQLRNADFTLAELKAAGFTAFQVPVYYPFTTHLLY